MSALVHVRIVTSDRVIHHFETLDAAARFRASRNPGGDPNPVKPLLQCGRGWWVLGQIAAHPDISSPEMADSADCFPEAINGVLRRLIEKGYVAVSSEVAHKRRLFRITPAGQAALANHKESSA